MPLKDDTVVSRILITGGSGFLGTHIVQYYLERGFCVANFDMVAPRNVVHAPYFIQVDLRDVATLTEKLCVFSPEYVIHLAARTDLRETTSLAGYDSNIDGTRNLLQALSVIGNVKRVVIASSMLVCHPGYHPRHETDTCPSTLYGKSKVEMEQLVRTGDWPFDWILVRPTSIWGPWMGEPYDAFFKFVMSGKFIHPGRRAGTATYGYVGNAVYQVDCMLHAPAKQVTGKTFYLGDAPACNLSDWADAIARQVGVSLIRLPYGLFVVVAVMGDFFRKLRCPFPLTSFRLCNMTTTNIINLSATQAVAPQRPYSMEQGIRTTVAWLHKTGFSPFDLMGHLRRFAIGGGSTMIVCWGSCVLMVELLKWHYLLANTLATLVAWGYSYIVNKFWVFKNRQRQHVVQSTKFLSLQMGLLLFGILFLYVWTGVIGWHYFIGVVVLAGIAAIINFLVMRMIVFRIKNEI